MRSQSCPKYKLTYYLLTEIIGILNNIFKGTLECWSNGEMRKTKFPILQHSDTPIISNPRL